MATVNMSTGLINSPPVDLTKKANTVNAQAFDAPATKWNITPDQTVESRVSGIIAKNSPLMQQAETSAKQYAATRGLGKSSMEAGAMQDAVIRAAMPIAQQDAQTAANSGQFNANAANTINLNNANQRTGVSQFNASSANQSEANYAQAQNDLSKMATGYGYDMNRLNAEFTNNQALSKLDAANKLAYLDASLKGDTQKQLQIMATAQGYDLQKMSADQVNALQKMNAEFQNTSKLASQDAASKLEYLKASQAGELQGDLAKMAASYGYDVNKMTMEQQNILQRMGQEFSQNAALANLDASNKMVYLDASLKGDMQKQLQVMAVAQGYDLQKMSVEQQNVLSRISQEFSQNAALANLDASNKMAYLNASLSGEKAMQVLKGDQAQALMETESKYKSAIQTSESAANFYSSITAAMAATQSTANMDAAQKTAAANYYNNALKNGLAILSYTGGGTGTDLTSLLKF